MFDVAKEESQGDPSPSNELRLRINNSLYYTRIFVDFQRAKC